MKTLVNDDPEEEQPLPNIDAVVVEKTETFWSFLKALLSSIWNFTTKVRTSPGIRKIGHNIWYGEKKKKS